MILRAMSCATHEISATVSCGQPSTANIYPNTLSIDLTEDGGLTVVIGTIAYDSRSAAAGPPT
ncbi:hypothetical protein [Duncaniella dubosii]|uniref:hypothetical protein n=1 Tax=Duncaniella dubosii TaxID=2518971 RepID=UPI003F6661B6